MDVINHCYKQLTKYPYEGIPIHFAVHDEVQDATQAELSLYMLIANSNNLLFTGDTCQTIARGVGFRFSDLRSLFHYKHEIDSNVIVPPVNHLIRNYRSHSGITNMAGSIVELMKYFSPTSFDSELPRDQGILEGNKPLLLLSPSLQNLYYLLFGESSNDVIEFGADQVVIVMNQKSKEKLPELLRKEALCLTVFESKGLEFNDVLLYDFFTDSNSSSGWRAIQLYQDQYKPSSDEIKEYSIPTIDTATQQRLLNENTKTIINELKFLYTAITRARKNIWIYDSDEKARKPIFDFFKRRGLVECINSDSIAKQSKLASSKSTPKQWKDKGNNFMEKKLYELAAQCFDKSGDKDLYYFAKGFSHSKDARRKENQLEQEKCYLLAAEAFLQSKSYSEAATSLFDAKYYEKVKYIFIHLVDTNIIQFHDLK